MIIFTMIFVYFSSISQVFPVGICLFLLKLLKNYPSQQIDHFPHLRIHFLCISVPKYQQFVTSAHINNSPNVWITF